MKERLESLRVEYERGQRHLLLLDRQRQELHERLLRIDGAIQVLEEFMAAEPALTPGPSPNAGRGEYTMTSAELVSPSPVATGEGAGG
jgi:hypothetical protein